MQGTGGIRKLRWSAQGKGKSGGVRVIYYHHSESMPLFLLTLFGKGEKATVDVCVLSKKTFRVSFSMLQNTQSSR